MNNIVPVDFSEALGERYFAYALSTITSRSLPDVRDGLKPVHRRLLFAMLQLKLNPESGFKKCARVVGDVIGKYHPHGDTAVYDAMVRLAQDFSVRYPMVDGQGNFGSVDGDNAAAMRYTEARMTDVAIALMKDLDKDTVDFQPNYDGSEDEPVVMPAAFPNLLANGSEGIAVGMATSIPPHNVGELCDALLYLIKNSGATLPKLSSFVKGPDFPTGGIIVDNAEDIAQAYSTGKGAFRVRAKWEKEDLGLGMYNIIITEIPYQVQKSRLMEKIADQFKAKKLALLGNIRDESAEDIRIVLEPKSRSVDPDMLMESLFKTTDLEVRAQLNMNVLDKGITPKVMNLKEVLQAFLNHRHEVLQRRSKYRLEQIKRRLEILDGLLIAYLNLDEVIKIIRNEDKPKEKMMKKWKLTDNQAEAILNMRLRQLRKLEEVEIKNEHDALSEEKKALNALLKSEDKRWAAISEEIKIIQEKFGEGTELGARRTQFAEAPITDVVSIEAFVEKEPITIICSAKGWIRTLKGHSITSKELKYKEGDKEKFVIKGYTTDKLIMFATDGRFYTIGCDKLPGGKGAGEPIRLMIDLDEKEDICEMHPHKPGLKLVVASTEGNGFVVPEDDVIAQTKSGKQVLNIGKGKAVACCKVEGDHIAVIGTNRKLLVFPLEELPELKKGKGVRLQKYKEAKLADIKTFNLEEGLSWVLGDRVRSEEDMRMWLGSRAAVGKLPPTGFPKNNRFDEA